MDGVDRRDRERIFGVENEHVGSHIAHPSLDIRGRLATT
jgi:hypothetical protein